jgi:hypothetical protein
MGMPPGLRALALAPERILLAAQHDAELRCASATRWPTWRARCCTGAREPALSSFPAALRRVERVEVMVLLREHGEARSVALGAWHLDRTRAA